MRTVLILEDALKIIKYFSHLKSSTGVYLLRHIQYGAVTLVFLLTVIQHSYSDIGRLFWGG